MCIFFPDVCPVHNSQFSAEAFNKEDETKKLKQLLDSTGNKTLEDELPCNFKDRVRWRTYSALTQNMVQAYIQVTLKASL